MTPAVIGGLFGLGTAGLSSLAGLGTSALNYKYQEKMARLQNELNLESWKIMQDYNTPANQVQRLVDAGLSPNLAYGSVSTGNVSSGPQFVAPQQAAPDFQQAISQGLGVFNTLAQNRLINANAKSVELDNEDKAAQIEGKSRNVYGSGLADSRLDGTLAGYYNFLYKIQLRSGETGLSLQNAKLALTETQNIIADIDSRIKFATEEDQIRMMHDLSIMRECESKLKSILLENQEYLQEFNQKSPKFRLIMSILSTLAGVTSSLIK